MRCPTSDGRRYDTASFLVDLRSGVRACGVVLPLSLAVALCSGAPSDRGLYSAAVGTFIVSLMSSEAHVVGPSLMLVVVSGLVGGHGPTAVATCALLAGVFLAFLDWAHLTRGLSQWPTVMRVAMRAGLATAAIVPIIGLIASGGGVAWLLALSTFALACIALRLRDGVGMVALGAGFAAWVLQPSIPTLADAGRVLSGSFELMIPRFAVADIEPLLLPALAIAIVMATEWGGSRNEGRPRPSAVAVGIANLGASLAGGVPVTSGFLRERVDMGGNRGC
jgi:SulP family sulfate permease